MSPRAPEDSGPCGPTLSLVSPGPQDVSPLRKLTLHGTFWMPHLAFELWQATIHFQKVEAASMVPKRRDGAGQHGPSHKPHCGFHTGPGVWVRPGLRGLTQKLCGSHTEVVRQPQWPLGSHTGPARPSRPAPGSLWQALAGLRVAMAGHGRPPYASGRLLAGLQRLPEASGGVRPKKWEKHVFF